MVTMNEEVELYGHVVILMEISDTRYTHICRRNTSYSQCVAHVYWHKAWIELIFCSYNLQYLFQIFSSFRGTIIM